MATKRCAVSFVDVHGIRHSVDVEAETLYEAVVYAVKRFRQDLWTTQVGPTTPLDVAICEPSASHSLTLQQVERWIASVNASPGEASRKAKLKMLLIQSGR